MWYLVYETPQMTPLMLMNYFLDSFDLESDPVVPHLNLSTEKCSSNKHLHSWVLHAIWPNCSLFLVAMSSGIYADLSTCYNVGVPLECHSPRIPSGIHSTPAAAMGHTSAFDLLDEMWPGPYDRWSSQIILMKETPLTNYWITKVGKFLLFIT